MKSKYLAGSYHYKDFETKGSTYRKHVIDLIKQVEYHLDTGSTILDVGCGEGLIMAKLKEKGYKVKGCDVDPIAVQLGVANGHDIACGTISLEHVDAVLLCDVLEHVDHFADTIKKAIHSAHKLIVVAIPDRPDKHAIRSIGPEDIRQQFDGFDEIHFSTRHARHLFIFKVGE